MNILFFGDVVGKPGREAVAKVLPELKKQHSPDLIIANVENLAHGKGVTLSTLKFMIDLGVDFFTSGNHIYDKPEFKAVFETYPDKIIRPANFAPAHPGEGYKLLRVKTAAGMQDVLIINLLGQVFMEKQVDEGEVGNPFQKLEDILAAAGQRTRIRILDFHAEATSEKRAMGFWSDGKLSAVLGTHTHIQTADAQILSGGTGYIADTGMSGAADSIIGVDKDSALKRFLAASPRDAKAALEMPVAAKYEAGFVVLEIDEQSGKCQNIISRVIYDLGDKI